MLEHKSKPWSCYMSFRLVLGLFDFCTDIMQSWSLISQGHHYWGVLTLLFPILAFMGAALCTLVAKCHRGNPMKFRKFMAITLQNLTTLFEGLLESGPQLILQTLILFHGVHVQDLQEVVNPASLWSGNWFRGMVHIFSLILSFMSLLVTLTYYNEERLKRGKADSIRFFTSIMTCVFSVALRVFLATVMFSIAPWISLSIVLVFWIINTSVSFYIGMKFDISMLTGYASLYAPSGYAKNNGSQPNFQQRFSVGSLKGKTTATLSVSNNFSEVERAKINQESLLKQVRISHGMFTLVTILSLIPYITLLEVYLFPWSQTQEELLNILNSRLVLYLTCVVLTILSSLFIFLFIRRIQKLRDAARHWFSLTPHRNRHILKHKRNQNRNLDESVHFQVRSEIRENSVSRESHHSEASTTLCTDTLRYEPSAPVIPEASVPRYSLSMYPDLSEVKTICPLISGTNKCGKQNCVTCELFILGPNFTSMMTGKKYKFMKPVTCQDKVLIYLVTCDKCKKQYVGKTEQSMKQRHYGHRREIEIQSTPLGKHFAGECGYSNWRMQVIDHSDDISGLKRKEGYWMHELMTLPPWGLNTRDENNSGDHKH